MMLGIPCHRLVCGFVEGDGETVDSEINRHFKTVVHIGCVQRFLSLMTHLTVKKYDAILRVHLA